MKSDYEDTSKRYILYRHRRDKDRDKESKQIKPLNEIIEVADNDINQENVNINAATFYRLWGVRYPIEIMPDIMESRSYDLSERFGKHWCVQSGGMLQMIKDQHFRVNAYCKDKLLNAILLNVMR